MNANVRPNLNMDMNFRNFNLKREILGELYLHSMPGRHESISSFLNGMDNHEIALIVSLTSGEEIARVSPAYATYLESDSFPISRIEFPIEDYGIPSDPKSFLDFTADLAQSVATGKSILIHCAAGIGRTGLTAASVLLQLGYSIQEAKSAVREAGSDPEIGEQKSFLRILAAR